MASAHEERDVGPYSVAVGFGDEPAYAGIENSVQMFIHTKSDKPVVDLGPTLNVQVSYGNQTMDKMTMEPNFEGGEFGIPGDYRAFFVPTRPGDYTFHFIGTIKGTPVNESFTSGPKPGGGSCRSRRPGSCPTPATSTWSSTGTWWR